MAKNITQAELKKVLNYNTETGVFTWLIKPRQDLCAGTIAGTLNKGYIRIGICGFYYKAHRLAWLYVYGHFPELQIDHINRIKTDNRISNLRCVSQAENNQNKGGRCTLHSSKINKYYSRVTFSGRQITFGGYRDENHAAQVSSRVKSVIRFAYDLDELKRV